MKGFVLAVLILVLISPVSRADIIVLVADEWCPFNCAQDSDEPGFLVEVARTALAYHGHEVVYRTLPWSRAINDVRAGLFDGIIGTGRDETPDFIFPDQPQAVAEHTVFTLTGSNWQYSGLSSLSQIRLGLIDEYSYGGLANTYIKANRNNPDRVTVLNGQRLLPRLIRLLELGRVDAFLAERTVLYHQLRAQEHPAPPLRAAGVANVELLYIAFAPGYLSSERYALALSDGLDKMRENGELARLRLRYGLQNIKQPTP